MRVRNLLITVIIVVLSPAFSFAAINININSGNPAIPFPQFNNYDAGGATYTVYSLADPAHTATGLALHQPDGLSLAEMELWLRDAWKIHSNEFNYAGTVTYQNASGANAAVNLIKDSSSPFCSEGHGYALLGAAMACDKDAFDGLWFYLNENGYFSNTKQYSAGTTFPAVSWGKHVPAWSTPLAASTADSATDGDDDIAMAALLAWKQWGDNTGYYAPGGTGPVNSSGVPAIQYKQMALDMMRFMVEKYIDSNSKYLSGDIGYDGYHKSGNTWNETTSWYTGPDPLEKSGPQTDGWFDYAAPAYFHAFGKVLQAQGDPVWNYTQFFRGEASDDWLMGQLASNPIYKNCTAGQYTVIGSTATFKNSNMGGEDFRAPWRTILNYLWNGNPTTSWDPVNHSITAVGNQYEYNAALKQATFMSDPQTYGTGITCENYGGPVTYKGVASWQMYFLNGTLDSNNWHIVYELAGPGAAAATAAQNFGVMGDLFRDLSVEWDHMGGTDYYLNSVPHYFHGFFRQLGLMMLTGNVIDPSNWNPKPNMKVFKSLNKTYAFPGDTISFWINYRNYGSVDAAGVKIIDTLPAAFSYVSTGSTGSPSVVGQVVTWNIGAVSGLHGNSAASYNATQNGVTLVVRVNDNAAQGRYCNFADISCSNGAGSTSSPFPNDVSTILCRTCVDIVAAALTITKTANVTNAQIGTKITYTINYCNSAQAGWINGGRSGVNFSFGLKALGTTSSGDLDFYLRGNHEAAEPVIDWANYRMSYFLNSPYSGSNWTVSYYNPEGFNSTPPVITAESFLACSPTACSDAIGSWNQRVMLQFGNFGTSTAAATHLLFWKATSTAPNTYIHMGTQGYAFFLEGDITASWLNQNWTDDWSQQAAWAVQPQSAALFPISPDWTKGDGTSTVVTKINKDACEPATNQITNILIEEWDGYTWRRVFGNGPMPGREVDGVHVIDSLPAYLSFGGVVSAPATCTFTASGKSLDWNIGAMQINQCGQIKYWVTVLDPGCPAGNGTVQTNVAYVKGDKEAPVSSTWSVTILCGSPTNTPTTGASPTFTNTATGTPTLTKTQSFTPTYTPSFTNTATLSSTLTSTQTFTPTSTMTASPTLSSTLTATLTATQSSSVTFTNTPTSTRTATLTFTVTDTVSSNTPTYTLTSTNSYTATSTYTASGSPTSSSTQTASSTYSTTSTYTNTNTDTPTYTATYTYTNTATLTHTLTVTDTESSNTPTDTPTFSNTPTVSNTSTSTATKTDTATITPSFTQTWTMVIFTATITPTYTATWTYSSTPTASATQTASPTWTNTNTDTNTKTITATPTYTATQTATSSVTDTSTITPTPMPSPVKLDITLEATGDTPKAGAVINYVITIKNNTSSPVDHLAVWDTLPDGMTFNGNNSEITPTQNGNYLYWDITTNSENVPFTLDPGQEITIEFTAKIQTIDVSKLPLANTAMTDYNDPFYIPAVGKHPAIESKVSFYPVGRAVVYPNPFNLDKDSAVIFNNVVPGSLIQIYTLSGENVKAIQVRLTKSDAAWDSTNRNGRKVSPGIYYFVIKNMSNGDIKKGKIFVIKGN